MYFSKVLELLLIEIVMKNRIFTIPVQRTVP